MGNPLIPPPLLLTKLLSLGAIAMIFTEREQLQAITTPFFLLYASNSIFGHFCPFFIICVCSWVTPWSHPCFDKNVITRCCCNEIYEKKAAPGHYNPIFPPYASNSIFGHFWPFFTIFHHFCPLTGDPMIPPLLLFTKNKMLPLGAVSMRSMARIPFQLTFYMAKNSLTWILDYLGISWMS